MSAQTTLMMWGPFTFQVQPMGFTEYDHMTGTAYAKKPVMQSIPQREYVGEEDEEITIRGTIFPIRIGGFSEMEAFEAMRRDAQAQLLIRGIGDVLGWFVCERMSRAHKSIAPGGVGQVVDFEALFARVDVPQASQYFFNLQNVIT